MMERYFNTNGTCYPAKHYMVSLDGRLEKMKEMADRGDYFVISRARQYGKTTTLCALKEYLKKEYFVILLSFQRLSRADFQTERTFVSAFADIFLEAFPDKEGMEKISEETAFLKKLAEGADEKTGLRRLFKSLRRLCEHAKKPLVLMIDEVDSASNHTVFLDFLAQLRDSYLSREEHAAFQSVILAGVYDIKNLKQKIRPGQEECRYNSPWNIAADFDLDMSFSAEEIAGMLADYGRDHAKDMETFSAGPAFAAAQEIFDYTGGYPYLVSRICQRMDRDIAGTENFKNADSVWTRAGVAEAVKLILQEPNTLFDDIQKKLAEYPKLRDVLYRMLFYGQTFPYHEQNSVLSVGVLFGFFKKQDGQAVISNRIFEVWFYNLFLSEDAIHSQTYAAGQQMRNRFVQNGTLNMELVLQKFMDHFTDIYKDSTEKFVEENGRRLFLLYLKPIINGIGNYYIESRTRSMGRTDVIVDYLGQQYVIEMKIWRGNEYNEQGRQQLARYLEDCHLKQGYLISFNFNKNKKPGMQKLRIGDKSLLEIVV